MSIKAAKERLYRLLRNVPVHPPEDTTLSNHHEYRPQLGMQADMYGHPDYQQLQPLSIEVDYLIEEIVEAVKEQVKQDLLKDLVSKGNK